MAELLQASVHHHPQDPSRRRLVQAFGGYRPSGSGTMTPEETSPGATAAGRPAEATPCELLTNREIEVLRMLQERLSNKEIAARLFVSAEPVKKHTLNLHRKLHVHGRRHAVATARQRRLLSSDHPALSPPAQRCLSEPFSSLMVSLPHFSPSLGHCPARQAYLSWV
jgi:DNA-binding CsgD family transcriptional regulator